MDISPIYEERKSSFLCHTFGFLAVRSFKCPVVSPINNYTTYTTMKNNCYSLLNTAVVLIVISRSCHGFVPVSDFGAKQCRLTSSSKNAFCKVRKQHVLLNSSLKTPPEVDQETERKIGSFNPLNISPMSDRDTQLIDSASTTENLENEEAGELSIIAARGLLLIVAMLWGTNFASVKYLETLCFHPPCNHPPSEAAFARFVSSTIPFSVRPAGHLDWMCVPRKIAMNLALILAYLIFYFKGYCSVGQFSFPLEEEF